MISLTVSIHPLVAQLRLSLAEGDQIKNLHGDEYPPRNPHRAKIRLPLSIRRHVHPHLQFLLDKYAPLSKWPVTLQLVKEPITPPFPQKNTIYIFFLAAESTTDVDADAITAQIERMEEEVFQLRTGHWIINGTRLTLDRKALALSFANQLGSLEV